MYRAGGQHPVSWHDFRHFGPTVTGRFDHQEPPPHDDRDRAILYVGLDALAAIAESFQDTRTIDRRRQEPWLVGFELTAGSAETESVTASGTPTSAAAVSGSGEANIDAGLRVLDVTRLWPTRAGASQAIATGRRPTAQAWSRAIYRSYPNLAGVLYRSSMAGGSLNVALYEKAIPFMPSIPAVHLPLSHPGLVLPLARAGSKLGYLVR